MEQLNWESMCLTYLAENNNPSCLLHCDTQYLSLKIIDKLKASKKEIDIDNAFKINGSSLNPDAVLYNSINSNLNRKKVYNLSFDNWNDFSYKTSFKYECKNNNENGEYIDIKIAYKDQQEGIYTAQELENIYIQKEQYNKREYLIIDSPLPNKFYSFWDISEIIDHECLNLMFYFNHFFYLALKNKIFTWEKFCEDIFKPLDISFDSRGGFNKWNVFKTSLFRYNSEEDIRTKFDQFISQIFNSQNTLVKIIDIKYYESNYFFDQNNMKDNKERNVRKQFVYEYLLQKKLKQHFDNNFIPEIESSFWIPDYRPDDSNLVKKDSVFLNDYIELNKINLLLLAENYKASFY